MKKKVLSLLLVAAMGISMLVGCGGGENDGTQAGGTGTDPIQNLIDATGDRTVKLEVWCSETEQYQAVMKEVIEEFKAAYPDVTFEITIGAVSEASAKDRVLEDVEAAADVFVFAGDQLTDLVKADALQPVSNYYTFDVSTANGAGAVNAATVDGQLYAYPFTASNGYFLYYNSNYVTAEQAKSWEGLLEAAKAANGQVAIDLIGWYVFGFFAGGGCNLTYDGTVNSCDWNSERGKAIAEAVMKITASDQFVSMANADVPGKMATDPSSIVAFVSGTWNAEQIAAAMGDGYSATKLPTFNVNGEAVQMGSFAGYKHVGVNAHSEETGWAMLLAEFITSEAMQTKIGVAVQEAPANVVASQNEAFANNVALAGLAAQAPYSHLEYVGGNYWSSADALAAVLVEGTTDVQKALDDAVAGITQP